MIARQLAWDAIDDQETWFALGPVGAPAGRPALSTLVDGFEDGSLGAQWTASASLGGGSVTETGGRLDLAGVALSGAANYGVLDSASAYDLTGSGLVAQIVQWQAVDGGTGEAGLLVALDANNRYEWYNDSSNTLKCNAKVAGSTTILASVGWATLGGNGAWLRISEAGGVISFASSVDGVTWTTRASTTSAFDVRAVTAEVYSGTFASSAAVTPTIIDNVNLAPLVRINDWLRRPSWKRVRYRRPLP